MSFLHSPNINTILALSPHADDMELGCGGTLARAIDMDKKVYSAVLSLRRKTLPQGFPESEIYDEIFKAHDELGFKRSNVIINDFEHRIYPEIRQELLDYLIKLNKFIQPDLVFIPSFDDMHQDHLVIAQEGFRAFKSTNIYSYELPWNRIKTTLNCYSILEHKHIKQKIDSLQHYKSQIAYTNHRNSLSYLDAEYVEGLAITRGGVIKKDFVEAFEIVRLIHP